MVVVLIRFWKQWRCIAFWIDHGLYCNHTCSLRVNCECNYSLCPPHPPTTLHVQSHLSRHHSVRGLVATQIFFFVLSLHYVVTISLELMLWFDVLLTPSKRLSTISKMELWSYSTEIWVCSLYIIVVQTPFLSAAVSRFLSLMRGKIKCGLLKHTLGTMCVSCVF